MSNIELLSAGIVDSFKGPQRYLLERATTFIRGAHHFLDSNIVPDYSKRVEAYPEVGAILLKGFFNAEVIEHLTKCAIESGFRHIDKDSNPFWEHVELEINVGNDPIVKGYFNTVSYDMLGEADLRGNRYAKTKETEKTETRVIGSKTHVDSATAAPVVLVASGLGGIIIAKEVLPKKEHDREKQKLAFEANPEANGLNIPYGDGDVLIATTYDRYHMGYSISGTDPRISIIGYPIRHYD